MKKDYEKYKHIGWLVGDGEHNPTFTSYEYMIIGYKEVIPIYRKEGDN